ncbi:hypothetical protein [Streptomyces sp. NBC_00648]|uniref:hypothetical protein n=1 Tax=Streptomyces sp. NBC_00648 TaxID=2975797 RepID=UPI003244C68B
MEIVISEGRVTSLKSEILNPQAGAARRIANYLPRPELLRDAVIQHNRDEGTTSIRFDTKAGPIRFLIPASREMEYQFIHDTDDGPVILGSFRGFSLPSRTVAFRISEFLRMRGLK